MTAPNQTYEWFWRTVGRLLGWLSEWFQKRVDTLDGWERETVWRSSHRDWAVRERARRAELRRRGVIIDRPPVESEADNEV